MVVGVDEKTQVQALHRTQLTSPVIVASAEFQERERTKLAALTTVIVGKAAHGEFEPSLRDPLPTPSAAP